MIPHEAILASAGSGKTYQLTNRYIALMALQLKNGGPVEPERIIAVTFTRKAAGEFFSSILVKLAEAASDPKKAKELGADKDDPLAPVLADISQEEFQHLLRVFIAKMPRLFLGTLDSFFSNILRSFPAEFGLASEFEVMDDYRAAVATDQVYDAVFTRKIGASAAADQEQKSFLESFRQATFGKEGANVIRELDEFVDKMHSIYLRASSAKKWGDAEVIWGTDPNPWLNTEADLDTEFDRIHNAFESEPEIFATDWWDAFRAEAADHHPGSTFPTRMGGMLGKFLENLGALEAGNATIVFNRKKHEFNAVACEAALLITHTIIGGEIRARLKRTRGVFELLDQFEASYAGLVRRQGLLTFQDIQLLLSGHSYGEDRAVPLLTQAPDEDDRLRIDYRLDARYDHWLLDEFQDTDFIQWKVIRNLIDEVVQDGSGTRSLFQVGDIKQAIYAWRGGDTRLFTDISDHYNQHEIRIQPRRLDVSWRSALDVLEPVNQVFRDSAAMAAVGVPADTIARWDWSDHSVAPPNKNKPGFTALLNALPGEGSKKAGWPEKFELVAAILEEVQPTRNGLSCAVLIQANDRGNELVDYIRAHTDIPVISESDQKIARDNPVNLALLSFFQLAAHPGDRFAWEHLQMTPYSGVVERDELTAGRLSAQLSRDLFDYGFETLARKFLRNLEGEMDGALDEFSRKRSEAFCLAARHFDETGSRDTDRFIDYVSRHAIREPVADSAVQVMTIHKSKGLTFDLAILPDLDGSLLEISRNMGAKTNENREVDWVFDLPKKNIAEAVPVLAEYRAEKEAEAAYESICKYYVAMTRAKFANYIITDSLGAKSTAKSFPRILRDTLASDEPETIEFSGVTADLIYQSNTPRTKRDWFGHLDKKTDKPESESLPPIAQLPETLARPRVGRRTPSGSENAVITAAQIFSSEGKIAREFGTLVHEFFEDIEWYSADAFSGLVGQWEALPGFDEQTKSDAIGQVQQSVAEPAIAQALSQPSADAECWREKNFEILLDGEWLSGTFDRVVLEADQATIIDFKTDRVSDAESLSAAMDKYRPQLETYRQVLAKMTGISEDRIALQLVFTRVNQLVTL